MEFIKKMIIVIIFLLPLLYFLPWWVGILGCIIIGFFAKNKTSSIITSSFALSGCWATMLAYRWIFGGEILMDRISGMLFLTNPLFLGIIILLLPLFLGGLAGISGKLLKELLD